jgi:hypothetical protein
VAAALAVAAAISLSTVVAGEGVRKSRAMAATRVEGEVYVCRAKESRLLQSWEERVNCVVTGAPTVGLTATVPP